MKKITMLEWTVRKAIKAANNDTNPLHGKALLPHIPIKMEIEVPDDEYEEISRDPRLHQVLHDIFKEEAVNYCRTHVVPVLENLNAQWDRITKLSQFEARWKGAFEIIKGSLPHICDAAEAKMKRTIAEDASLRKKYKHYRWKVAKQTGTTALAVGTAAAATAGSVAAGGAPLGLAIVALYRSVTSAIKLVRDCAIEAETCQKNVVYGLAYLAHSYGLTDSVTDSKEHGEDARFRKLAQADMAGYSPRRGKEAGNTAKELSYNFFVNSVLKWPIKKRLASVKDIQGETELWENKLANLSFQSRDLSVKLNELLEKTDDLKYRLGANEALRSEVPDGKSMPKSAARNLDKDDKAYNRLLKKVEKDIKQLLEKGFYIPSMGKWLTIDELYSRAEAGLKKLEMVKPILKALGKKGLAKGTLIASDALDLVVGIGLAVAGDTTGPAIAGAAGDKFKDALSFMGSNWFDCFTVPQDVYATTNSLYSFAVDTCGAPAAQAEIAKILLEA